MNAIARLQKARSQERLINNLERQISLTNEICHTKGKLIHSQFELIEKQWEIIDKQEEIIDGLERQISFLKQSNHINPINSHIINQSSQKIVEIQKTVYIDFSGEPNRLANTPGTYAIYDKSGKIAYIGMSCNLGTRIKQSTKNAANKIGADAIGAICYHCTDTEEYAYEYEAYLIEKYNPYLNVARHPTDIDPRHKYEDIKVFRRLKFEVCEREVFRTA